MLKDYLVCRYCGKRPHVEGRLTCDPCAKVLRERARRQKRARKQARRERTLIESNVHNFKPADEVRLVTPDNPRLNGALARIVRFGWDRDGRCWGAHVETGAAKTGRFRAHWSEMHPVDKTELINPDGAFLSFNVNGTPTGKACPDCGNEMVRRGQCPVCPVCGKEEGCS